MATRRLSFKHLLRRGVLKNATRFPGLLHFTFDPYLIMLRVKQGGTEYHFLSLWYNTTVDLTAVSGTVGEHTSRLANWPFCIYSYIEKLLLNDRSTSLSTEIFQKNTVIYIYIYRRCSWCSRYRRRKWTRRHEFNTRLIAFHIALIPLGKVWIQLFSLQLWVNSRTD